MKIEIQSEDRELIEKLIETTPQGVSVTELPARKRGVAPDLHSVMSVVLDIGVTVGLGVVSHWLYNALKTRKGPVRINGRQIEKTTRVTVEFIETIMTSDE